jgi:acetyl/propionyl-CoA carboxylase alpha subunit
VVAGSEIPIYYDPMIAKLIVWGKDRPEAISRMKRALEEYRVSGVETTIGFHRVIMDNDKFVRGELSTRFLEEEYPDNVYRRLTDFIRERAALAVAIDSYVRERKIAVTEQPSTAQSNWSVWHRVNRLRQFGGSR